MTGANLHAGPPHPRPPAGDWRWPMLGGFAVILLTFGIFGGWSAVAKLDSAIVANGTVVVESERKLVQHLEGGIVAEILVDEDRRVVEGQVLLRMDATAAKANLAAARSQLAAALGEESRLKAELDGADAVAYPAELDSLSDDAARVRSDQDRQFADRKAARRNGVSVLQERIAQSEGQIQGLDAQVEAARAQSASYADEIAKLRPLADKGLIAVGRIRQLERAKIEQDGRIGSLAAERKRQEGVISEARLQVEGLYRKADEEASGRLTELRGAIAGLRDKIVVTQDVVARSEVRAPRTGRIVASRVHTVGAVVRPGDVLMEIVPEDDTLVISARLQPIDVTHVRPGLAAEVRLPAFKSRTTPIAVGEVRGVSADVVRDEATRQPFYELKVSARVSSFPPDLRDKLIPGMPAEVVVATGERTVADYLTQPLTDALRRGMREY